MRCTGLLPAFIEAGLKGLEVYRPRATPRHIRKLERVAKGAGLIVTGGSDWHDPERGYPLGSFFVTEEDVGELIEAGGSWRLLKKYSGSVSGGSAKWQKQGPHRLGLGRVHP